MNPLKTLSPQEAKRWLDTGEAILIDVREPAEYRAEHIQGSHLVPLARCCPQNLPPVQGRKVILHCKAGKRGEKAGAALCDAAGIEVYNLAGGLDAWVAAGLPVEKGRGLPLMRQVQIAVGGLVVLFTVLGMTVHPGWHVLAGLVGLGLLNAGVTGWCGMALLLAKMPWNRRTD